MVRGAVDLYAVGMFGSTTHFVGLRGFVGDTIGVTRAAANGSLIVVDAVLAYEVDGKVGLTPSLGLVRGVGIVKGGGPEKAVTASPPRFAAAAAMRTESGDGV